MNKDHFGVYRICIAIWILTGLAWFAAILTAVQETMEKTSKKIVHKDNDSVRDVNGNQEAFVQSMCYDMNIYIQTDIASSPFEHYIYP